MTLANRSTAATLLICGVLLGACGGGSAESESAIQRTPVTVARASLEKVQLIESTVGRLESLAAPILAAETSGRVARIDVDGGSVVKQGEVLAVLDDQVQRNAVASARATVDRLKALSANQERTVKRYLELRSTAVSESMLEEAIAQQAARRAELANAEAQLADAEYRLSRTRIRSPIDATVERRLIAPGDFVVPGTPVVAIVGRDQLRANLPFPERLSGQLQPGLPVLLEQPTSRAQSITGTVKEVRPMVGTNNRALEVIVELPPGTDWPPGGSVSARLVLANRESVVVPVECVVRRPAGDVVYVLENGDRVSEREVTTGIRDRAVAEIVSGLQAGETVIASGAGFLTDGALVKVREAS